MDPRTDYMGPLKSILLSTDASEHSEGAVKEAIYLAKSCIAQLSVLHVLETNPEFETEGQKFVEKMENAAWEHLNDIKKAAARENVEVKTVVVRTDQPYKAIVDEAAARGADVIVMGRHGRTGLKRMLMGSVTAKVIGHAHCNVLVVPRGATVNCKNLFVAVDGSRFGNMAAAEAVSIARRCGSNIAFVSVVPSEEFVHVEHSRVHLHDAAQVEMKNIQANAEGIREQALKEGVPAQVLMLSGSPAEAIVDAAGRGNADLIIIGSHGRTGLDRLVMGSVAERVIALSPCAVLVVKSK